MVIEYKIKFEKDGVTITERLESGALAQAKPHAPVEQNSLAGSFHESLAAHATKAQTAAQAAKTKTAAGAKNNPPPGGDSGAEHPGDGGGPTGLGTAPVTFIGPFVWGCCPHSTNNKSTQSASENVGKETSDAN